ncbi:MAG: four helix bundle suffix domain-containing protein [Candidatus Daviesbacteria bacterium]|nr:four helix bundle suffix domain-containing protein [Candidatus Daviesbacteria bacterium]
MGLAGFKYLKTYQLAVIIFDLNMEFVRLYIDYKSRTKDQMEQAGRSGKQNIAEGYLERSLKMYIKLVGVSRGSFGELLEDYEDFARLNNILVWGAEKGRDMREMRDIWAKLNPHTPYIPSFPNNPETAVNLLITLLNQENYLLDRQIKALEEKFIKEGGYSENLFKKRLERRERK